MTNRENFQNEGIEKFLSGMHYVTKPKKDRKMSWQEKANWVGYNAASIVTEKEKLHCNDYDTLGALFHKLSKNCLVNERVFSEKYIESLRTKIQYYISKTNEQEILFGNS